MTIGEALDAKALAQKLHCNKSTVYERFLEDPTFPRPHNLAAAWGGYMPRWYESEVDAWLRKQPSVVETKKETAA